MPEGLVNLRNLDLDQKIKLADRMYHLYMSSNKRLTQDPQGGASRSTQADSLSEPNDMRVNLPVGLNCFLRLRVFIRRRVGGLASECLVAKPCLLGLSWAKPREETASHFQVGPPLTGRKFRVGCYAAFCIWTSVVVMHCPFHELSIPYLSTKWFISLPGARPP